MISGSYCRGEVGGDYALKKNIFLHFWLFVGGAAELLFPSRLGDHTLSLLHNCRQLYGFSYNVPMETREEAGYSVKSSIKVCLNPDLGESDRTSYIGVFPLNCWCSLIL